MLIEDQERKKDPVYNEVVHKRIKTSIGWIENLLPELPATTGTEKVSALLDEVKDLLVKEKLT